MQRLSETYVTPKYVYIDNLLCTSATITKSTALTLLPSILSDMCKQLCSMKSGAIELTNAYVANVHIIYGSSVKINSFAKKANLRGVNAALYHPASI